MRETDASAATHRLFFALWPDAAVRAAFYGVAGAIRKECGGRATAVRNLHLTLAFLGDVPVVRLPELHVLGASIRAPRFDLHVDALGYWRHNRIVWAGVSVFPPALSVLVEQLTAGLKSAGFRCEDRSYVPHVTLVRDARTGPRTVRAPDAEWAVSDFALVRSARGKGAMRYEVLRRWRLRSD
ncbi:MAG: RNA 2',3'-cyclic phosphodiesterase [Burkholderiales bacterium]|nr:RNA 2',3'-cyclic phosphodiesterase [Burkholderiales bacterium]